MAARLSKHHSELVRQKIQASVIIDRLHRHLMGKLELSATQLKAADILLERSVPKLAQIQHTGADGEDLRIVFHQADQGVL